MFSIIILDAVRVVSFSHHEHLSGSKFALRTQLSRERKSCLGSFIGSCVLEYVSTSGDAVICNVMGSTGNLTVSILDGFRVIGSVAIQLVAWPVMNLSESLLLFFVGIEGFVPFRGHFVGISIVCNFVNASVDAILAFEDFLCPYNFSDVGKHELTRSIRNPGRISLYAVLVYCRQPSKIIGSVLNSVFMVSGFDIPPNSTWTCKLVNASEVSATEANGQLLCPIPISAVPSSQVSVFASSLQQLFVGILSALWSSHISLLGLKTLHMMEKHLYYLNRHMSWVALLVERAINSLSSQSNI